MLRCPATRATERPELLGRALVVVDQLVELERVDLTRVQLREAVANVVEEQAQLLLVVLANQLTRRSTTRLLVLDIPDPHTFGHRRNLPPAAVRAHPLR